MTSEPPTTPPPDLPTHEQIAAWLGYAPEQKARIRAWLDQRGIRYDVGPGGRVCTTLAAINQGMLRKTDEVEFA